VKMLAVLGVLVVTACGTVPAVATLPRSDGASSSRTSSPTSVANPPASSSRTLPPPSMAPLVPVNLDCRLPVWWGPYGAPTYAGFLSFPMQTLAQDSTAPAGSTFYDRAYSKWLPTTRNAVSTDGSRYAYAEGNAVSLASQGKLHVVDVATGADHVIYSGSPVFHVIDFASEGIYLTPSAPDLEQGLWLMNPSDGQPKLISSTILRPTVGNGAAWGLGFNSADPNPGLAGMIGPQNEVLRYDLSNGSATPWLYQPGASFEILGLDYSGNLFLDDQVDQNTFEIWEVDADAASRVVYFDGNYQALKPAPSDMAAVDSYGTWFNGRTLGTEVGTSVWLATGGRLQQVATVNQDYLSIAGGCIPRAS
jgi:hypothetical protein